MTYDSALIMKHLASKFQKQWDPEIFRGYKNLKIMTLIRNTSHIFKKKQKQLILKKNFS